jgi:PAS domain S-box-containing protein
MTPNSCDSRDPDEPFHAVSPTAPDHGALPWGAEVLLKAADACRGLVGATAGCLALRTHGAPRVLVYPLNSGADPQALIPSVELATGGLPAEARTVAGALFCNDLHGRSVPWLAHEESATGNALWAPILVNGAAIGGLGLASKPGGFVEGDAELAQACAALAALASGSEDEEALRLQVTGQQATAFIRDTSLVVLVAEPSSGRIVYSNPAAQHFYGYTARELKTLNMADLSTGETISLRDAIAHLSASGASHFTARHRLHNATLRDVTVYPTVVSRRGTDCAYCIIHDVTEQLAAEVARNEQSRFQALVMDLSMKFTSALPDEISDLMQATLEQIAATMGAQRVMLWQRDGKESVCRMWCHTAPGVPAPPFERLARSQMPWLWEQLLAGVTVARSTPNIFPVDAEIDRSTLQSFALGSHAFLPLMAGADMVGVLSCASTGEGMHWQGDTLDSLSLLARMLASLLARKQAHEALLERLRFETVVTELSTVFASSSPEQLGSAIKQLLGRMLDLLDCDRAALGEFSDGGRELTNLWYCSRAAEFSVLPEKADVGLTWYKRTLIQGETIMLHDVLAQLPPEAVAERAWSERANLGSHLAMPVRVNGQVTHRLAFETRGRLSKWSEDVTGRISVVADLIGRALEREQTMAAARDLQNRLAHAGRVMATGELTAAFAHQMNQPLTAIVANARAAQRFLASDQLDLEEVDAILGDVSSEALRAGAIISHMRDHLRRSEPKSEPIDLCAVVSEVTPVLNGEAISRRIRFRTQSPDASPTVKGDRVQLQQVVVNLVMNAFDAVQDLAPDSREVTISCYTENGATAVLAVDDNGCGLPQGGSDSVFEAFVTSKPAGLGLGLSISRSIAMAHGGTLEATSPEAGSTRFELRLPITQQEP